MDQSSRAHTPYESVEGWGWGVLRNVKTAWIVFDPLSLAEGILHEKLFVFIAWHTQRTHVHTVFPSKKFKGGC